MPNLDGGHYFLTVIAPIRVDTMIDPIVGRSRSHLHVLAQRLALLYTGRQTEVSPPEAKASPFAANTRNHLARFVIINNPTFNGRLSGDTLLSAVRGTNPLTPQSVDRLNRPYLLFAADLDAPEGEASLKAYTDTLWATMSHDLKVIFNHCAGFEGVDTAEAFYAYILRCQVETTMPFNDYWADGLKAGDAKLPVTALKWLAILTGGSLALWLLALFVNGLAALFGASGNFARTIAAIAAWGAIVIPLIIGILLLFLYGLYRSLLQRGLAPLPSAPNSDLPSVLKALFVQQNFTRFAAEAQALDKEELYRRFGAFLKAVRPTEAVPTQPPGEVLAPRAEWAP